MKKLIASLLIVIALPSGSYAAETRSAPGSKPNIIYFIIDELGYYESSHLGHPVMQTPNIDRLAAEGTRFTQLLAGGSVCAPTRCAVLTGKHTGHSTIRNNGGFDPLLPGEETMRSSRGDTQQIQPLRAEPDTGEMFRSRNWAPRTHLSRRIF